MKVAFALLSLMAIVSARADDAAWTYVGTAGNFSHNQQIRMVSERVDIKLKPGWSHFRAKFVFRNEGPATTVTMAFPEEVHDYGKKGFAIRGFFSSVDGKAVKVHRKPMPETEDCEYCAAWLKTVSFRAHQTRHVLVDYEARNGDIGDFVVNRYVLKTGSTWKGGAIDDALITVDWSDFRGLSEPTISLRGDPGEEDAPERSHTRRQVMRFHHFKPTFDVQMTWSHTFSNFLVNGDLIDADGLDEFHESLVDGPDSDPIVATVYVQSVFGEQITDKPDSEQVEHICSTFSVGKHHVKMLSNRELQVDGKNVPLRRWCKVGHYYKYVYLRDVVEALHGKFHYNRKLDRDVIWVK